MTTGWTGATRWLAGPGALDAVLRHAPLGHRAALVYDAGAAATPSGARLLGRVRSTLPSAPVTELAVRGSASVEELSTVNADWRERGVTGITAVGGGCTLDIAVLAALPTAVLRSGPLRRGRSGLVTLAPSTAASLPTLAVPTTLGTGAEVSAAACCDRDADGKVLVIGDALRPAYAAVDATATEGLPVRLVREALIEILARILVPFCASPVGEPAAVALADELSLASLRRLGAIADETLGPGATDDARLATDDARLAIATVSAHSHAGWCNVGRPANCSPVWPVATELASLTGLTKAEANGCLLPAWAGAVLAGVRRWGDAGRLHAAWRVLSEAGGYQHLDPERGLAALVDGWIGPPPESIWRVPAAVVGERAVRRWGDGLPVLGRFRADEIGELVAAATAGSVAFSSPPRPGAGSGGPALPGRPAASRGAFCG